MTGLRQGWLVAIRELRERSRSRAFQVSMVVMLVVVLGAILMPVLFTDSSKSKDVGLTGSAPAGLAATITAQGKSTDTTVRVRNYDNVAAGENAVRRGKVDVLVVDGQRLEWRRLAEAKLQAIVTSSIQLITVSERAAGTGISPAQLRTLLTPVPIKNVELGSVAGRSPDDETATVVMGVLLLLAISTYGGFVLTGVVEEKSSRVVEVLLARMPARSLLAGKVAGIGLLGLAQFVVTGLVALSAASLSDTADIPAARAGVIAWVVLWFVLGYALYAMTYGALGSLASRPEEAQTAVGPVLVIMIVGYFASFLSVGDPRGGVALFTSYFPATAPFSMPNRIAMGAVSWWEPALAAALTIAAIAALVVVGGRVYAGAILHTGPTVRLRDAWRGTGGGRPDPDGPMRPAQMIRGPWSRKFHDHLPIIKE